jgi:hypothetical protein
MYPVTEQQITKTLKPCFIGFSGMNCFSELLPLKATILSSTERNLLGLNAFLKTLFR